MNRRPTIALWGCGNMGPIILRYALEKGADVVGVIDRNSARVGRDVGEVTRLPIKGLKVIHPDNADKFFEETPVDVCVVATRTAMSDISSQLLTCTRHRVNAITISEEATYPYTTSPVDTSAIDASAKKNGVTVFGSGYTDWAWVVFPAMLAGSLPKITLIEGFCQYNVNDYGSALCEKHGVGLSPEEFANKITKPGANGPPCYGWNSNEGIAASLGLTITKISQRFEPTFAPTPVFCAVLNKEISVGQCTGMQAIATVETAQGITIVMYGIGKVYGPGDKDTNDWNIKGDVNLSVQTPSPPTAEMTCSVAVNRIPQVINAPSGYLTAAQLPPPQYLAHPMAFYVKH